MNLLAIAKATQIAAAVSSIALARRRAEHVPAAVALVVLTLIGLLRGPLRAVVDAPGGSERYALVYVDGAAELATSTVVAGLAVAVAVDATKRRRVLAGGIAVWALASIVLGAMYPSPLVKGAHLQRIYFAADLIALFVSAVALARWLQRGAAMKRSPDSASLIAIGLVSLDGAILLAPFSPWRGVVFGSDFSGIQLIIAIFFATFAVAQVAAWRFSSRG